MSTLYDKNGNPVEVSVKSKSSSGDVLAIISLILGIISIVFSFGYLIIPCAFGIPVIILGRSNVERSKNAQGLAKAGKICGIIGVILGVLFVIGYVLLFVGLMNM